MKRAKRILVTLLTLALALSLCAGLAACGNSRSDSMDADTDRAPAPEDSYDMPNGGNTMPNGNGISSEPDPIQEPTPTPKVLPEVVTNFDTTSGQVDSDNGYDIYYVTDKGLALFNPATGEEMIVMELTGSISTVYHMNFLAVTGQRSTYEESFGNYFAELKSAAGNAMHGELIPDWYFGNEEKECHSTVVFVEFQGGDFGTPIEGSVRILYDEDGNIHSYSKKSENTTGANNYVRRIGRAWLYYPAYPSDFEYFWGGGSYEEQGTKEVAMWATLMTDDIALSVKNCANVYRWPGVEDGDRGYCLAAQSPNGEDQRVLWVEKDGAEPILDAIIEDKVLYHYKTQDGQENWVYDLTTGEKRPNYLVPTEEVAGFTPTAAYLKNVWGVKRLEMDRSQL